MSTPDELYEHLLQMTTALVVELHPAIQEAVLPGQFPVTGIPAAAVFKQPLEGDPTHRSGPASDPVAELALEAADRAREQLAYGRRDGNPLLPALALACFYLVDARQRDAFGLAELTGGRVRALAPNAEDARHDPPLLPGTAAIRAWFPVEGEADACVELRLSPAPRV